MVRELFEDSMDISALFETLNSKKGVKFQEALPTNES